MSTKTIKQRIAVVAASALTVGLFTAVSTPSASATLIVRDAITATTTFTSGANVGVCFVASAAQDDADATNTVEMLSTGKLTLTNTSTTSRDINDKLIFTITGPAAWDDYSSAASPQGATGSGTPTLSNKTLSYTSGSTFAGPATVRLVPTGVGTIQVAVSEYSASTTVTTQVELITIQAKATCASGAPASASTYVRLVAEGSISNPIAAADGTSIDASGASYAANAGSIYVRVDAYDANGSTISDTTSATGSITASVSSGAFIGAAQTGTTAEAYTTDKSTYFKVTQATDDVPWNGTITIKLNGSVISTKSARIVGKPATIEVSGLDIAQQSGSVSTVGDYVMKDSAGNVVEVAITGFVTLTEAQGAVLTAGGSVRTPSVSSTRALAGTDKGVFQATCATGKTAGTVSNLQLRYVFADLTQITSAPFSLTCGESAYTYSASLDKASYVPGDVATLTITAKGQLGNSVFDGDTLGVAGSVPTVTASNMTAVLAPTYADTFTGGKKTYTFTVGATEGSYNMIVDLAEFNSSSKPQSAITIPFKIASGVATVTNADVLKSIVSLIASINKQIQALQKLILRR
jgi:hypothetical protein